ncbi:MAG: hypothetical protein U5N27_04345 [Rhizobium sp.]|nr:hypothetical protein [Rhizobium sp.]
MSILGQAWKDLLDSKLQVKRDSLVVRQRELNDQLRREAKLEGQIERLQSLISSGECSLCGQAMEEGHRHKLGASLGEMEVELAKAADASAELQSLAAQIASLSKIRGVRAKERLADIERDLKSAEVGLQKAENEIENIQEEISGQDTAELARKRVLKDECVREEGRLQTDINNVKKQIDQIKLELAISQKAIEGIAPDRARKSTIKSQSSK